MKLVRPPPAKTLISLVPMIDVMLILLVFFMVTSTYLNLDMIPLVQSDKTAAPQSQSTTQTPLLIHLTANGRPRMLGQSYDMQALKPVLRERLTQKPQTDIIVLPSGAATTQQLVSLIETATLAGANRVRVIRLKAKSGATR